MADTKMASEGQKKFIGDILRIRMGNPQVCGDIDKVAHPVPHIDFRDDMPVVTWIGQMTFEEAKSCLKYLVTLPEPPAMADEEITHQQKSKIWAILKALSYSTYNVWTLRKDDRDIPHLHHEDWQTSVWDWMSELTKQQGVEIIDHLEATQALIGQQYRK